MKRNLLVTLLITVFMAPVAHGYGGVMYSQAKISDSDIDDVKTGNLGLVLGDVSLKGFGVEGFFSFTVDEDEDSDFDIETSVDVFGVMGVYRSPGPTYVKAKIGIALVEVEIDQSGSGKINEEESGWAYGIAVGTEIGSGALELSYTLLPELENVDDFDVNYDVDMIGLTYLWGF